MAEERKFVGALAFSIDAGSGCCCIIRLLRHI